MAVPPLLLEDAMDISIGLTTGFPNRSTPFLPNVEVGGRRLMLGFCTVLFCTRGGGRIVGDEAGCFFGGGCGCLGCFFGGGCGCFLVANAITSAHWSLVGLFLAAMVGVGVGTVVDGMVFGSISWLWGTALDWSSIVVDLDVLVLLLHPSETASGIDDSEIGVGVLVSSVSVGRVGVGFVGS